MKTKMKWVLGLCLTALLGLVACRGEVQESDTGPRVVRIYDVEMQDEENVVFQQHFARAGVLKFAGGFLRGREPEIPFANQVKGIEEESGISIDYVMLKSWDELREKAEEAKTEDVTTIVLLNNSYDGSLIQEANSGRYADMEPALREFGFYDEEAYNQAVLKSGVTESGHVLVPLLYNVPGMIQGDSDIYSYSDWKAKASEHAENAALDFNAFLDRLKESMKTANVGEVDVPFLSPAFLEEKVDLFLMASGADLALCEKQEELFNMLYDYLMCYEDTQVKVKNGGLSNQILYGRYLHRYDVGQVSLASSWDPYEMDKEAAAQLQLDSYWPGMEAAVSARYLFRSLMERTYYFVECSTAEEVAFHSVFGMLAYRNYYVDRGIDPNDEEVLALGNMNYWPIGILNSNAEYAAQPLCYAAVVSGGNTRLAAEAIQAIMNQPTDVKYGISVCNPSKDAQLEKWKTTRDTNFTQTRYFNRKDTGAYVEFGNPAIWDWLMDTSSSFLEDKGIYTNQVAEQIDHIVVARIPDREVLTIWQDALVKAVSTGLSAEEGFELLCERMEKRNMEKRSME